MGAIKEFNGSCVYVIKTTIDKKIYVGSAVNYYRRKSIHISDLKRHKHHNFLLQNLYDQFGETVLIFEILEKCKKEDLIKKEQFYINMFDDILLNICRIAGSCLGRSITWRDKISKSKLGHETSIDTRNKIGLGNKNKTVNQLIRDQISKSSIGKKKPPRTKVHSNKISLSNSYPVIQLTMDNRYIKSWNNMKQASKYLHVPIDSLYKGIEKGRKSALGYKWKFIII
jgi:group I intron endonuclease